MAYPSIKNNVISQKHQQINKNRDFYSMYLNSRIEYEISFNLTYTNQLYSAS